MAVSNSVTSSEKNRLFQDNRLLFDIKHKVWKSFPKFVVDIKQQPIILKAAVFANEYCLLKEFCFVFFKVDLYLIFVH